MKNFNNVKTTILITFLIIMYGLGCFLFTYNIVNINQPLYKILFILFILSVPLISYFSVIISEYLLSLVYNRYESDFDNMRFYKYDNINDKILKKNGFINLSYMLKTNDIIYVDLINKTYTKLPKKYNKLVKLNDIINLNKK